MDDARLGRAIRVLRQRRNWRQADLAARAGLSRGTVSALERGHLELCTLGSVRQVLASLDASAHLSISWGGGGELDRLLDAGHARLVDAWSQRHRMWGWDVWPEASYSVYGERGRIDLLAYHAPTRTLEVAEMKTTISDTQDTLGRHDVKIRLADRVAASRGWRPTRVVGALVVMDGRTARRRVGQHRELFARYDVRGHSATAWVRDPSRPGRGLLVFMSLPYASQRDLRRAGQLRVRPRSPVVSANSATGGPAEARFTA